MTRRSPAETARRRIVAVASYDRGTGRYEAVLLPREAVEISRDGLIVATGRWFGGRIHGVKSAVLPPEIIDELSGRLFAYVSIDGERLLYHYRAIAGERSGAGSKLREVERMLLKGEAFFASPRSFEDQDDCSLVLDWKESTPREREDFIRAHVRERDLPHGALARRVREICAEDRVRQASFWEPIERGLREDASSVGVFCLTKHPANAHMWANYADRHRGVCLTLALPARGDGPNAALEVEYADRRAVSPFDSFEKRVVDVFRTKGHSYAAEDEFRCINTNPPTQDWIRFSEYPFREVLFGKDISPVHRNALLLSIRSVRPDIRFFDAVEWLPGRLTFEPVP